MRTRFRATRVEPATRRFALPPQFLLAAGRGDAIVRPNYILFLWELTQMPGKRPISVFVLGLLALSFCGCDEKMPMWTGLGTPPTKLPGVASPAERMKSLKELAERAPATTDPGQ